MAEDAKLWAGRGEECAPPGTFSKRGSGAQEHSAPGLGCKPGTAKRSSCLRHCDTWEKNLTNLFIFLGGNCQKKNIKISSQLLGDYLFKGLFQTISLGMWLSCQQGRKQWRIIGCKTKLNWNVLKGLGRPYTVWADTALQAWLSCPCLLNCISTCTICFLSKWMWENSQKHWDTWQESSQVGCSDHSFMFSDLEIGQSIHQWQQISNKKHEKPHKEIICLLPFSG